MTALYDPVTFVPPQTLPTVPQAIADAAASLRPCSGCSSLPGACMASLTGMGQRPCCPACDHHPELPRRAADIAHSPETCAAWADGRDTPRGVACEAHWLPDAVLEHRAGVVRRYWEEVRARSGSRRHSESALVSAERLYRESHGPGRGAA